MSILDQEPAAPTIERPMVLFGYRLGLLTEHGAGREFGNQFLYDIQRPGPIADTAGRPPLAIHVWAVGRMLLFCLSFTRALS